MAERKYVKTPTIYQMEATECGAASLAMILGYFGKHVPLEQMRIECGVTRDGSNARNLMRAGKRLGLEVHGYRKEIDGLLALPVPCILHWNFNHFVVWEGVKGGYCYINDPGEGRRKLTLEDVDDCFTGVVLTFKKTPDFVPSRKRDTLLSFIGQRLKDQYGALTALAAIGFLLIFPGFVIPVFSQFFIDEILIGGNDDYVTGLLLVMIFTLLFRAVLRYYRGMLLQQLQNKITLISAHRFLTHFFRLPIGFFSQRYAGDLSQRVENNNNIGVFLTSDIAETVLNIMTAVFYLILLFIYSPLLTFAGLAIVAVNLMIMKYGSRVIGEMSLKMQQDEGRLFGSLFSGIMASASLKASGTENEFAAKLQGYYAMGIQMDQRLGRKQDLLNAIPEVTDQLTTIIIMVAGALLVIEGRMTEGMLVAYNSLLSSFMDPINNLAGFVQKTQTAKADMRRIDDIMRYRQDSAFDDEDKAEMEKKLMGYMELDGISFGYSVLDSPLVEDFSFYMAPGRSIAFVGASGSGKSTVAKICSGLYKPWEGEVLFDGIPLKRVPQEVLAASVATVSQEITLFSGTVRDNLTMWNSIIPQTDVVRAAKDACIHDLITSKPGAYDFMVTEGGANFSGGQRQRLEIARALVTNPSILIMDEATSALDPVVEKEILDNIKRRGCTCIIVAHRLSAIRDCDEIIVMDHGKIVQRGVHDTLAKEEGHYQRLIQTM
ncbi:MAG: NHLP family bacteriocin export ABC transporter peptidase/permease/ATPase subunit [Lachnospiraceae bacterium]|nr:NHLP family bacteriocin export ABC transporter peptidase/permease/ATPase subunit [Lachnospiraceae bacterium]